MKRYTLRGQLNAADPVKQLVVDDGRYKHGFVIETFRVWTQVFPAGYDVNAVLSRSNEPVTSMTATNAEVFAWAVLNEDTTTGVQEWSIVDPQHVINQDMYLHNVGGTTMEYLITMRDLQMTDDQGVLQLVKNLGQS